MCGLFSVTLSALTSRVQFYSVKIGAVQVKKITVRPIDTHRPNSSALQSICCSAEAERVDEQTKKISGCYENFHVGLSYVQGLGDLDKKFLIQIGQRHALIPKHTVPAAWTYVEVDSLDLFYSTKYAGPDGTPSERVARRAALAPGSAVLVCRGGEFFVWCWCCDISVSTARAHRQRGGSISLRLHS